jgi:glycosyltransferase involved in cell wall biosynthesis
MRENSDINSWPSQARRFVLVEATDFLLAPVGGQLTMARHLVREFGDSMCLVGTAIRPSDVGRWTLRDIEGRTVPVFSVVTMDFGPNRPVIPDRLTFLAALLRYRREIGRTLSPHERLCMTFSPEALLGISGLGWMDHCHKLPGTTNPLSISRYSWARPMAPLLNILFLRSLSQVSVILAAADERAIREFVTRSNNKIKRDRIRFCATRYDECLFYPRDKLRCRQALGLKMTDNVMITVSRLNREKGIDLLLDAFSSLHKDGVRDIQLLIVGDGEARAELSARVDRLGCGRSVRFVGLVDHKVLPHILSAADVYVSGSFAEGWPTSVVEAMACGLPVVSTDVSGVSSMIDQGKNGWVVFDRDAKSFADALRKAFLLGSPLMASQLAVSNYSDSSLGADIAAHWPALKQFLLSRGEANSV